MTLSLLRVAAVVAAVLLIGCSSQRGSDGDPVQVFRTPHVDGLSCGSGLVVAEPSSARLFVASVANSSLIEALRIALHKPTRIHGAYYLCKSGRLAVIQVGPRGIRDQSVTLIPIAAEGETITRPLDFAAVKVIPTETDLWFVSGSQVLAASDSPERVPAELQASLARWTAQLRHERAYSLKEIHPIIQMDRVSGDELKRLTFALS